MLNRYTLPAHESDDGIRQVNQGRPRGRRGQESRWKT